MPLLRMRQGFMWGNFRNFAVLKGRTRGSNAGNHP